ncbi:MAG: S46 family peptidase [Bacteroidales bacterium]|nr:S46 family peptidase [Bacteroidales bacterium]
MKRKLIPAVVTLFLSAVLCRADEGMWLIHLIEQGLAKNMQERGLQLDPNTLYDEEKGGLSDAVVSLAFGCSGSMISSDGLMITNHHCAYSDVHALSTPEHNYLEDGFWAMDRSQEAPVKGDGIWFLKKVIDVTSEVQHLRDSIVPRGGGFAMRRVYSLIEGRYGRLFKGQGEVSCSSMWGGNKYYMALYEVYKDVRLVAAPPICIASFGGEVDNWEWPQHKGDFALYRIYTAPDGSPAEYSPDNIPMKPSRTLKISTAGVQRGDFAMVIGYPGRTDRYASSFKVNNIETVVNPIQVEKQGEQMKIIDGWMNLDPAVRLKYADHNLS